MADELIKVVAVSKDVSLSRRLSRLWPNEQVHVAWEPDLDRVLERFENESFDVLLVTSAAFRQGHVNGIELLDVIGVKSMSTQVLFLAPEEDIKVAMSALKAGSFQYVRTPVGDTELKLMIETAFAQRPAYGSNQLLKRDVAFEASSELLGHSQVMLEVVAKIQQAASTDIPVLIQGETGTGKDLVAEAIHRQSERNGAPFIPVNIGALPTELVGSELFGYEKGAFTGATESREGKFELGHMGTVFLDEVGTIDEKVQISLLRLIDQKRFHRLGGQKLIHSDIRLVAATNEDLSQLVQEGGFREDLFFRLAVFQIDLPPLRERVGDIPLLIELFLSRYGREFQKTILKVHADVIKIAEAYPWPGNVRELKNVIQHAVLICDGEILRPTHLPERLLEQKKTGATLTFEVGTPLEIMERQMILETLSANNNNRKRTAELLQISRRALYYKLEKYGIS